MSAVIAVLPRWSPQQEVEVSVAHGDALVAQVGVAAAVVRALLVVATSVDRGCTPARQGGGGHAVPGPALRMVPGGSSERAGRTPTRGHRGRATGRSLGTIPGGDRPYRACARAGSGFGARHCSIRTLTSRRSSCRKREMQHCGSQQTILSTRGPPWRSTAAALDLGCPPRDGPRRVSLTPVGTRPARALAAPSQRGALRLLAVRVRCVE